MLNVFNLLWVAFYFFDFLCTQCTKSADGIDYELSTKTFRDITYALLAFSSGLVSVIMSMLPDYKLESFVLAILAVVFTFLGVTANVLEVGLFERGVHIPEPSADEVPLGADDANDSEHGLERRIDVPQPPADEPVERSWDCILH